MSSPATTPLSNIPLDESSQRFIDEGAPCEWAEEYRPGGFHPVDLGHTFRNGKYKVIRKLGEGSYSTVWLAASVGKPKYVAVKIMAAKASTESTELGTIQHLSKLASKDPKAQYVAIPLDTFQHQGPNGKHQCLVYEPMGTTAASLVEELPENKPKMYGKVQRYPKWIAKKILLHTLHGLEFLHRNGIVHGDIQPGNLLFSIENLDSVGEDELKQDEATTAVPLQRIDGKIDRWAPRNLYISQPLHDHVQVGPGLKVTLSDLGSAFWSSDPPKETVTPLSLRAPELILHQPFGSSIDIWSFGCLLFEFITERVLFAVMMLGHDQKEQDDADDDHLIQLNDIIQELPDSMMASWPRANKWYKPDRQRLQPYSSEVPYIHDPLDVLVEKNKPADIDEDEAAVLCALMRRILDYSPEKRPSATELLKHPWFSE